MGDQMTDQTRRMRHGQKKEQGFMADLIHITAIKELRDIGYADWTLIRKLVKELELAGQRRSDASHLSAIE
jgi:hypothetical protein